MLHLLLGASGTGKTALLYQQIQNRLPLKVKRHSAGSWGPNSRFRLKCLVSRVSVTGFSGNWAGCRAST